MSLRGEPSLGGLPSRFSLIVASAALGLGILVEESVTAAVGGVLVVLLAALLSQVARVPATSAFAAAVLLSSALVDLPGKLHAGVFSANAGLTGIYAFLALLVVVRWRRNSVPEATRPLLPFMGLLSFAAVSVLWGSVSIAAIQNLLVLWIFIACVLCGFNIGMRGDDGYRRVAKTLNVASIIALALYGASLLVGGLGAGTVIGSRSFALLALVIMAWGAAGWRYHAKWARSLTILTGLLVLLSLSRTAFAAALVIVCVASISPKSISGWIRLLATITIGLGIAYVAVNQIRPLHNRIYTGDLQTVAGVPINVEGRASIWRTTWHSYLSSPIFGHGVGTADNLIARLFANAGHPHNDYLRLLHDFGLFGFMLWILGYAWVFSRSWSSWHRQRGSAGTGRLTSEYRIHATACLSLVGMALAMVTDNVLDYLFVMGPVGVLVGLSLGLGYRMVGHEAATGVGDQ